MIVNVAKICPPQAKFFEILCYKMKIFGGCGQITGGFIASIPPEFAPLPLAMLRLVGSSSATVHPDLVIVRTLILLLLVR